MNCLTNICYVCLKQKDKSLVNINSSLSVNEDIIHIIGYLPCNLGWMRTKPIILICDDCCRRFRETYQFLIMCRKNSAVLQGFMAKINTASVATADTEADSGVDTNNKEDDMNGKKCETKSQESGPIIEESEEVFMDVDNAFVKDEGAWKREAEDDEEAPPMENNSSESSDNESETEIAVNSNTHDTDTESDSSEAASTQVHTTNTKEPTTPAKISHVCLTCNKSFSANSILLIHTRMHTGEKPYKCTTCTKSFGQLSFLVEHTRSHTGEKPFKCTLCGKCFRQKYRLVVHMRTHTGEKPYECPTCKKCFIQRSHLSSHLSTHSGEKPYECSKCKKCFRTNSYLTSHMRIHSDVDEEW